METRVSQKPVGHLTQSSHGSYRNRRDDACTWREVKTDWKLSSDLRMCSGVHTHRAHTHVIHTHLHLCMHKELIQFKHSKSAIHLLTPSGSSPANVCIVQIKHWDAMTWYIFHKLRMSYRTSFEPWIAEAKRSVLFLTVLILFQKNRSLLAARRTNGGVRFLESRVYL